MSAPEWERFAACSACGVDAGAPCVHRRSRAEISRAHTGRARVKITIPYVPPRERGKYTRTDDFLRMLKSMVRAAGERVSHADMDDLRALVALEDDFHNAVARAIEGMREDGYSWKDIGAEVFGLTGQAVYYRYGKPKAG